MLTIYWSLIFFCPFFCLQYRGWTERAVAKLSDSRGLLMWSTKWLTNKSKQQSNQVVNYLPAWITARERWSFVTVLIEHFVINVILLTRLNRARLRKSQTVLSMLSMSLHQWNLKYIFFVIFLLISDTISITNANLILLYIYFKC